MTTIAYHHKSQKIAIDSRITAGSLIDTDNGDKIYTHKGRTFFMSGMIGDHDEFAKSFENGVKHHRWLDVSAIAIIDGVSYVTGVCKNSLEFWACKLTFDKAIGSGGDFAKAAMHTGSGAREAVIVASEIDVHTGGKVRVFDIETMKVEG